MRPDFALDFRDNKISLLHRAENAWVRLGQVDMSDPDLDAALAYLRATALGLSPRGIASQLIVPNDLILYTRLDGLPRDPTLRAQQIGDGLAGRTPYDLADLVYDWADDGEAAQVAVVARETLVEAEGFAAQHRFNPVCFAAWPAAGDFDGEVWFGTTATSQTLLAPGEVVERDAARSFVILPEGALRSPVSAQDFEMGQKPQLGDEVEQADAPPLAAPTDFAPIEAAPAPKDYDLFGDASQSDAPAPLPLPAQPQTLPHEATPVPVPLPILDEVVPAAVPVQAPPVPDPLPDAALSATPALPENAGQEPASFDAAYDALSSAPNGQDDVLQDEAPMAVDVPIADDPLSQTPAANMAVDGGAENNVALVARAPKLGPASAVSTWSSTRENAAAKDAAAEAGAAVKKDMARPDFVKPGFVKPGVVKHVPAIMPPNGKQNLSTIAKAKPKPRLGMGWILTLLLLLVLVAVAALSQMFLETTTSIDTDDTVQQASLVANPAPETTVRPDVATNLPNLDKTLPQPAQSAQPEQTSGADTLLQDINLAKLPPLQSLAELAPDLRPNAPAQGADLGADLGVQTLATTFAPPPRPLQKTAQLQSATAQSASVESATVQNAKVQSATVQMVQMPTIQLAQAVPAPIAAVYADPRLAKARPAPRPVLALPQDIAQNNNAAGIGLRPAPRPLAGDDLARASRLASAPASLVASAALDATEDQLLGLGAFAPLPTLVSVPNASDLSQIRPLPRQGNNDQGITNLETGNRNTGNLGQNPLALSISPRPAARPQGLAAAFERRQIDSMAAAATAEAAPDTTTSAQAEEAPPETGPATGDDIANAEAIGGEEVTRDNGGAGTRSIVTKQSTQRNAMNLSAVNLVGIFGSNANRYALIRRANGTFKKLKVGDRFDGGRVAAITESEVRYDKGGDLVALTLPNG